VEATGFPSVHEVLRRLVEATRRQDGFPEGVARLDSELAGAALADAGQLWARAIGHFASLSPGTHGLRPRHFLTACGGMDLPRGYTPGAATPFPVDAALNMREGMTPAARSMVTRSAILGGSFAEGSTTLSALAHLRVPASTLRRKTYRLAKACEAAEKDPRPGNARQGRAFTDTEKARRNLRDAPGGPLFCSLVDATGVPVVPADTEGVKGKGPDERAGTREIKVGVCTVCSCIDTKGRPVRDPGADSFIASGGTMVEAVSQLRHHADSRGFGVAVRKQFIADGATSIDVARATCFKDVEFTVDFCHAAHYLHAAADALDLPSGEARRLKGLMFRLGVESAIDSIRKHHADALVAAGPEAAAAIEYLDKRRLHMRYGWLRKNGYFIGSGIVEAACRTIAGRRCKQSGMHWRHRNAILVAILLAAFKSGRLNA
jgi:hypothetical protein